MNALLEVRNLRVEFGQPGRSTVAVDGIDLTIGSGERVAIVGESGSGKSVSMLAILGLVDAPGRVSADLLRFDGHDMLGLTERERRAIIGKDVAMIFQDAQSSLNPSYTIGFQLMEALQHHLGLRGPALRQRAIELLEQVEIPDPASRMGAYPHQLSGGMNQRVMIAMALSCEPRLLIADEPTTALDVTVQAQIMELLIRIQQEQGMALLLITHDLALVAEMAREVNVMYAGQIMESSTVEHLFRAPAHPYTHALLAAIPEHNRGKARLATLGGVIPGMHDRPGGCLLAPRCAHADLHCSASRPVLVNGVRCIYPRNAA